ncbi:MAG: PSD1 and planctomycete cytochrome C domain-containing protein, partial [Pirellulaceae bacterium]|nr:PSD1 and planctomycete cytochrome C domain-containing protein [Pirellulaceae bacterium]
EAGDPAHSELIARVRSDDPELRMPPPDSGKELTSEEVGILERWIAAGAAWSGHWAFETPRQPAVPEVSAHADWVANPIDAFIAAQWASAGLEPAPPASPHMLLRRVYLDLIGLPPTVEQADRFLADTRAEAYDQLVEELLTSPHYGEKWARHWLDAARYADSDGFEKDKPRQTWMYRDWVIDALNRDLPYDQFIVEQIAGDLLPSPTQDQMVATGFLRQSMLNEEGGIDPEQFRMEAMFDRLDAIGKGILGITVQCAQCHSHKYDPLTQSEYYQLMAFVNNSYEGSRPVYPGPELAERNRILSEITAIEQRLRCEMPDWPERMMQWAESVRGNQPSWTVLDLHNANDNAQRYLPRGDGSLLAQGYAPTKFDAQFTATTEQPEIRALRIELLSDPDLPAGGPGRSLDGLCALTELRVEVTSAADAQQRSVAFAVATADFANEPQQLGPQYADQQGKRGCTGPADYAIDGKDDTAWGIDAGPGRRNVSRRAVFTTKENVAFPASSQLRIHLVQMHGGWNSDDNQTMNLGRFRVSIAPCADAAADPLPASVRDIVESGRTFAQLSPQEADEMFSYWRTTVPQWSAANEQIESLWRAHPPGTTQLVLQERAVRRPTYRLDRGDFLKPLEEVFPGTPGFLHPLEPADPPTRLDFARWLVDRRSPTTARSIVNRIWQAHFGTGLVETSEDLGSQSAAPSHPALLDFLAAELMDHGWSLKWLHRQIVTSATYRQSSHVTPEKLERDSANRLLARGPRFRLEAELVRDIALASSGLLSRDIGGPSVHPPAPEFLFVPPASYGPKTWVHDTGPAKYRRGLYTFRFRSVPYPAFAAFDAPEGTSACTRRSRSNTPLQALTTLNEPLFVECAQALARDLLRRPIEDDDARITLAFRRCVSRNPTSKECEILARFLAATRDHFATADDAAELAGGAASPPDLRDGLAVGELAAWTAVCRVILNLDETITKP